MEQVAETLRSREYAAQVKDGKVVLKLGLLCSPVSISYDHALGGFRVNSSEIRMGICALMFVVLGLWKLVDGSRGPGIIFIGCGFLWLTSVILTEVKLIEVRRLVTDINQRRKQDQN